MLDDLKPSEGLDIRDGVLFGPGSCLDKDIIIPEGVVEIKDRAFCFRSVNSVVFPNTLRIIGDESFSSCLFMKSLFIPASVEKIGKKAFGTSFFFDEIKVDSNNKVYDSRNDCGCIIETKTNVLLLGSSKAIIPNGIVKIEYGAFDGRRNLVNLSIPESVKEIGNHAFNECRGLKSIKLPKDIKVIGMYTFNNCKSFTSLIIPDGITSIGDGAFSYCDSLKEIIIPDSVVSIGKGAFSCCKSLKSITLSNSIEEIKARTFVGCESLESIHIPAKVKKIDITNMCGVFDKCNKLQKITVDLNNHTYDSRDNCNAVIETSSDTLVCGCKKSVIPTSIKTLGDFSFHELDGFSMFKIPEGVKHIGSYAFRGCTKLNTIIIPISVESFGKVPFPYYRDQVREYYLGSKIDYLKIKEKPEETNFYFYSEEEPKDSGKYWHYEGKKVVAWDRKK